jgi:hypothetical protein
MTRYRLRLLAFLVLLTSPLSAQLAVAEIYKWVDAEGKVHFGDKPLDPAQAAGAEVVELKESYRPTERTAEQQEAYRREQQLQRQKTDARRGVEQKADDEQTAERRKEKAVRCAAYAEDIKRLTTVEVKGRTRSFYYTEEDGKSVSSTRQREIIAELRAKMAAEGCP